MLIWLVPVFFRFMVSRIGTCLFFIMFFSKIGSLDYLITDYFLIFYHRIFRYRLNFFFSFEEKIEFKCPPADRLNANGTT
jgi:hypothetical protein